MPAPLALALCTAAVLYLLWLERRESPDVSAAVWIPTLWMMAMASKSLAIWFGLTGDNEAGSLPDKLLLAGLSLAGVLVLARRRFDWTGALARHGWLLALLSYMFISTLWSDITFISFKRWGREVIVVIMALVIMSETKPRQALESLLRRSAYILIPFSLMLIKYYRALGVDYGRWSGLEMWVGVTVQKNTFGRLCLISAFFLLWALYRRWRNPDPAVVRYGWVPDFVVLVVALDLLRGAENAYSATSIGTFAVGCASLLALAWLRKIKLSIPQPALLALVVLLIGSGVAAPFLQGANLAAASSAFGRDATLTGRTETWSELVPVVERQPLIGSGFGSFWTTARRDYYEMSNGHNGYLDTVLELGAMGLALFIAWLVSSTRKLHRALAVDYDWGSLAICFLLMAVVYNATESTLNSLAEQMTIILVFASMVVPNEPVRAAKRSRHSLRLHLPAQRVAGTPAAQPGESENGRLVRILGRGRGQRRRRPRAGDRSQVAGRTGP